MKLITFIYINKHDMDKNRISTYEYTPDNLKIIERLLSRFVTQFAHKNMYDAFMGSEYFEDSDISVSIQYHTSNPVIPDYKKELYT